MIVGTAGHIDHGKTLLVHGLTGVATDRLKEEKARGISIELGFAYIPVPESETSKQPAGDVVGFVDVPGHERFVHTMVAGATGIDFALIVVAADDGVMPQTREHVQILDLLGVADGVVALNKIDLVDRTRLAEVEAQIQALLAGTSLEGLDILPVSAAQGTGVSNLRQRLLEEAASRPERSVHGTFRMAIDRCFTLPGAGTIVTGAVRSGSIKVGDKVRILPAGRDVRVRTLHAQGRECAAGHAGERCALNLARIEKSIVKRGHWLVATNMSSMTARFDAELKLLTSEERAVRTWSPVHMHVGTTRVSARIVILDMDILRPGDKSLVQIVAERPLPLVHGDLFIIRDVSAGRTMGGGHVVDPHASRHRRRTAESQAKRAAHCIPDPAEAVDALLSLPPGIVDWTSFVTGRGLSDPEAEEIIELLELEVFTVDGRLFVSNADAITAIGDAVTAKLAAFHEQHRDVPGVSRTKLRDDLEPRLTKSMFDVVIAILSSLDTLVAQSGIVRLPSHSSGIGAAEQKLWERISAILQARQRQPPPLHEIAGDLNQPITDVRKVCKIMVRYGVLVELKKDRFFLKVALFELGELAHEIARSSNSHAFTVAEFRDRAGCGRAIAVQVLEYFDRRGITGRKGDRRVVSKKPADIFGAAPIV